MWWISSNGQPIPQLLTVADTVGPHLSVVSDTYWHGIPQTASEHDRMPIPTAHLLVHKGTGAHRDVLLRAISCDVGTQFRTYARLRLDHILAWATTASQQQGGKCPQITIRTDR